MQLFPSLDENSCTGVGVTMVLMVLPRAPRRLLETFISDQRELVYSFPGLLIFSHIPEAAYI